MLYYLLHSLVSSMFVGTQGDYDFLYFIFWIDFQGAHKDIMLASPFCFQIDICTHTRISSLSFFSDWFNLHFIAFLSDRYLLAHEEIVLACTFFYCFGLRYMTFLSDRYFLAHEEIVLAFLF